MSVAALTQTRQAPSRAEVEDLLYDEAFLLDGWRLDDWLALFAPGATYEVPPANAEPDANSATSLFYIADDYERLGYRVDRLKDVNAHAEYPRSRCARLISNVRVLGAVDGGFGVRCAFITHRSKGDVTDIYFGHHHYVLAWVGEALKIAAKTTFLDMSSLRPQGRVSIIV
jgi:p-cumate 2,3-dioxygenase beta subunit